MGGEMARLAERKTAAETELNTTASKLWEEYQLTEAEAEKLCVPLPMWQTCAARWPKCAARSARWAT